jgi:hypothetical protein
MCSVSVRAGGNGRVLALGRNGGVSAPAGTEECSRFGERFRWLTAPHSTVVQPGPVHSGLTADPAAELTHLFDSLVQP